MTLQAATRTDQLVIVDRIEQSTSVTEFVLERADGSRLPDWAPGAHIDIVLPSGKIRQYSLCGDRWAPHQYRIAVQREDHGSGGSVEIHEEVQQGDVVSFGGPRNNFRLAPAQHYRFIAGGIGITAMLPMMAQAEKLQVPWQLLYLGKTADRMAYRNLAEQYPQQVTMHTSSDHGRASIQRWLGELPEDTIAALQAMSWPGNIRQLRNVIERVLILAEDTGPIRPAELESGGNGDENASGLSLGPQITALALREARELFEREYLINQIARFGGNISRTAQFVGMERSALHRKLKSLGVVGGVRVESDEPG